jgi:hypothetical protein
MSETREARAHTAAVAARQLMKLQALEWE